MAFSTEGWRKIIIADQVFFWQAALEITDSLDSFRVRPERGAHRLLRVGGSQCGGRRDWLYPVTPGVVRGAIEHAIANAWLAVWPKMRLIAFDDPLRFVSRHDCKLTAAVVALVDCILAERAFNRLPILADALQDGGCDNKDIVAHCLSAGPHDLSCWVVNLVLDKCLDQTPPRR